MQKNLAIQNIFCNFAPKIIVLYTKSALPPNYLNYFINPEI